MRLIVALAAVMAVFVVLCQPAAPFVVRGNSCPKIWRSEVSYARTTMLLKNHTTLTGEEKRRVARYVECVATRAKSRAVRRHVDRLRAWRKSYPNVWPIRRSALDAVIVSRLATLRGCETRGVPYPTNYRWNGHHKGAYQYDYATWSEAQAYYAAVTGERVVGWTSSAHVSSPAHQDVVTAYFFPSHTSRWECRA